MAQFKYQQTFTFKVPKVKMDTSAVKKERLAVRKRMIDAHLAGMHNTQLAIESAVDTAMMSFWTWPRGGTRMIYDTGRLMNSKKITTKHMQTKSVLSIAYTAPYAAITYYGGVIHPYGNRSASVLIPGRPWVEAIFNGTYGQPKLDLASHYNAAFKLSWNKGK